MDRTGEGSGTIRDCCRADLQREISAENFGRQTQGATKAYMSCCFRLNALFSVQETVVCGLSFSSEERMKHILTGPFQVNSWIIPLYKNTVFIVDPAACVYSNDAGKIVSYLTENSLVPAGFLLTHGHFDHITGTGVLKKRWPAVKLVCHTDDRFLIGMNAASAQADSLSRMGIAGFVRALSKLPDADVYVKGGESLRDVLGGEHFSAEVNDALSEWRVIHTPGHSPGSVCYYNAEKKTLVSGDTVFYRTYGRTDLPGGSDTQIIRSLYMLKETLPPDTLVYPGHEYADFPLGENFQYILR